MNHWSRAMTDPAPVGALGAASAQMDLKLIDDVCALLDQHRLNGVPLLQMFKAEVERLRAEIAQTSAPSSSAHAWQAIETAPQDRTWFLAWSADLEYFVYRMGPGLIAAEEPDPTHWMPLPDPPSSAPQEQDQ
jgi:hypothetical protein